LLFLTYQENSWSRKKLEESQLAEEKETWVYFPNDLSTEELLNPYITIKKIFKKIKPQMYRDYLQEWLHAALYTSPIDETVMPGEVITVYENILKLYAASWLIYQRETKEVELKDKPKAKIIIDVKNKEIKIKGINPNPTAAEKLGLGSVNDLIVKRFPSVQMIVHLGTHSDPFTFFLLILIKDNEKIPEGEVSNKIEDHCKFLANVHTIVHKATSAKSGLTAGNRFWTTAIKQGNIIYQAHSLELPLAQDITNEVFIERAVFHWERWGRQGKDFLEGTAFYMGIQNYRLAAFLLHQAVESTLKALIHSILGYRVQMHNLSRLLRLSLLIMDDLKNEFKLNTIEGVQHFSLLQNAYSQSRYSSSFDPDGVSVKVLFETVTNFYAVAEEIQGQFIEIKKQDNR
jgi:HEPN domain-containing protein